MSWFPVFAFSGFTSTSHSVTHQHQTHPNSIIKIISRPGVRTQKMQKALTCNSFIEAGLVVQVFMLLKSLWSLAHDLAVFILGVVPHQGALQEFNGQPILLPVVVPYASSVVLLQSRQAEKSLSRLQIIHLGDKNTSFLCFNPPTQQQC